MDGQKFRRIMAAEGITQAKLADALGCTPQNISAMLNKKSVKVSAVEKLAELIGKTASELLSGESGLSTIEALREEIKRKDAEIASLNARIDKLLAILEKQ